MRFSVNERTGIPLSRAARKGHPGNDAHPGDSAADETHPREPASETLAKSHGGIEFHAEIAAELGAQALHLPLPLLEALPAPLRGKFSSLGASCHSVEDALRAQALGGTYLTAGHISATDCKKGLAPRGLEFLREVCQAVEIPVWAIGGIRPENLPQVLAAGAAGGCVMSGLMACPDPAAALAAFAAAE